MRRILLVLICVLFVLPVPGAAQDGVEPGEKGLPDAVSAAVKGLLATKSYDVKIGGDVLGRFWLRGEVPQEGSNQSAFGVGFGGLKPSVLIGVLELDREWRDYKAKPVKPGIFTLRYGLQPADGNHTGVSSYRDYVLLIPAAEDADPAVEYGYGELNLLSSMASGTVHPAVMALFPLWEDLSQPHIVENELGQKTFGIEVSGLKLGFVVEGHGEIEGY